MDLGTMEARLASRTYYITLNMFAADFYKMVKNCQVRARAWAGLRQAAVPTAGCHCRPPPPAS